MPSSDPSAPVRKIVKIGQLLVYNEQYLYLNQEPLLQHFGKNTTYDIYGGENSVLIWLHQPIGTIRLPGGLISWTDDLTDFKPYEAAMRQKNWHSVNPKMIQSELKEKLPTHKKRFNQASNIIFAGDENESGMMYYKMPHERLKQPGIINMGGIAAQLIEDDVYRAFRIQRRTLPVVTQWEYPLASYFNDIGLPLDHMRYVFRDYRIPMGYLINFPAEE